MTNGFVTPRYVTAVLALALALACSGKQRTIEAPEAPATDRRDWDDRRQDPDWGAQDDTATLRASIPEKDITTYIDPNARVEFNFSYLDQEESGAVTFAGGKAELTINDLPTGKSGEIKLDMFENGSLRLRGTKPDVTLKSGINNVRISLTEIDDGNGGDNGGGNGGDDADLVLDIDVIGSGGSGGGNSGNTGGNGGNTGGNGGNTGGNGGNTGGNGGNTGGGGSLNFGRDILPLAKTYCNGCHGSLGLAVPDNEAYWSGRKSTLAERLQKNARNVMPQSGSREGNSITDDERQKFLDYISSL